MTKDDAREAARNWEHPVVDAFCQGFDRGYEAAIAAERERIVAAIEDEPITTLTIDRCIEIVRESDGNSGEVK